MDRRAGDRHFMELAVGEMLESRSEHSRKPDPLVGAVIVDKDGTLLGKTHRASIREGAHAEYLLIDNLLHDVDLEGATLYVTLEPCTNRSQHFTPCVDRILSARISRVFIGIPDPNPRIEGHGIVKLANAGVQVDFFDSDLVEKIRLHNRDFIDYFYDMESDEGYDLSEFVGPSKKEREIVGTSDLAGLSLPHIMEYVAARQADLTIPSRELWKYMAHSGLVAYDSHILSYRPTIAGLLLFGQNPENFLVQSPVLVEAHIGDQVISEDICGPLLDMPQAILDFLSRHMRWFTEIHGLKRVTVPEYPHEALREAVVNALVHRSYEEGARIHVKLQADRIVVRSPGLPVFPITVERLRTFNAPPFSRNPHLASALRSMRYMEERGWGISRMRDLLAASGLSEPTFTADAGYLVLTIFGRSGEWHEVLIAPELLEELRPELRSALNFVLEHGKITTSDCAELLSVSPRTARKLLYHLRELGILRKRGAGPSTHYILNRG